MRLLFIPSLSAHLDAGELYVWGYGKAVGFKYKDIVIPTRKLSHYTNIVELAAGATHSLALTGMIPTLSSCQLMGLYDGKQEAFLLWNNL